MGADFGLFQTSEEHEFLRASIRSLAEEKIAPHASRVDEYAEFPQASYEALVQADMHAVHIPTEYGGVGADALATCIVVEEIARVCASTSLIPGVNKLGTLPLLLAGSEDLKKRYLAPVASGEAMFSFALTEPGAGSDAAALKTRAVRDGDTFVLNGTKRWISNAGVSQYYTVFAVTDPAAGAKGISAFVVERDDEGVSFGAPEHKLGIKGSPTREVYLENVRISADRLIGELGTGYRTALGALEQSRVVIAAQAVGIAQGALDYVTGYVTQREQFGKALAKFQAIQMMLADMAIGIASARQMAYTAAAKCERGDKDLAFYGSAAKCLASDVAMQVTTDAVQMLGGYGYSRDYPVERMMRDAKITQIYEGTNQILRLVAAREQLASRGLTSLPTGTSR